MICIALVILAEFALLLATLFIACVAVAERFKDGLQAPSKGKLHVVD